MKTLNFSCARRANAFVVAIALMAASLVIFQPPVANAAAWNGIEPLKSRRADVERVLGKPLEDVPGQTGTLRFKVAGGVVKVSFVTAKFIATKKLLPELEGTVLQVVLQHERPTDTPQSLGITSNSKFEVETKDSVAVYRNLKDGIVYTFVGGKLKTTYFTPSSAQWSRAQKGT